MSTMMMWARPSVVIYLNSRRYGDASECGVLCHEVISLDGFVPCDSYIALRSKSRPSASECQMELLSYSRAIRSDAETRVHTRSRCRSLNYDSMELSRTVAAMRRTR